MQLEQLVQELSEGIVFGAFPPGTRLIEDRLIDRFGVSRHVVRQAFVHLRERGLIHQSRNRGAEVIEPTPDEVDELYEVRKILETSAARMTQLPADREIIAGLEEIQRRHEGALDRRDYRAVFYANIDFHRVQYSACSNSRLREAIADFAGRVHFVRAIKYDDKEYMSRVVSEHHAIIDALKSENVELYVASVEAHIPASGQAYRRAYEIRHGTDKAKWPSTSQDKVY